MERGVELISWMKREAQSYKDWASAVQVRLRMEDAQNLLDWIEELDFSDIEPDLARNPKLLRAVMSPVERIKRRRYEQEEDRWDDIVDWLFQIPGFLRGLVELEGRQADGLG